jgi:hypothetical protein
MFNLSNNMEKKTVNVYEMLTSDLVERYETIIKQKNEEIEFINGTNSTLKTRIDELIIKVEETVEAFKKLNDDRQELVNESERLSKENSTLKTCIDELIIKVEETVEAF